MERLDLTIDGMSCGHCVSAVKRALEALPGVAVDDVRIGAATVRYDEAASTPDQIVAAVAEEGYQPRLEPSGR